MSQTGPVTRGLWRINKVRPALCNITNNVEIDGLVLQHVSDEVTKSTKIVPDWEVSAQDLTDRQQIR